MTEARPYAIVTGAGRGIGKATAIALARRGLSIALIGLTRGHIEETASAIADVDPTIHACDVADEHLVGATVAALVKECGAPLVVVNNAGIVRRALVEEMSVRDWDAVMGVNLRGTFLVTRAVLGEMRKARRGRIINVASVSATLGTARQAAYNASKWGVVGFTKSLAEELRGSGVSTLAVLPGAVDTDMLTGSGFAPQMTPDVVANTLVFAALDAPDAMNGSALEVFGP